MARTSLSVQIRITGLGPTLRAVSQLPKEAQDRLRDASLNLSQRLAVSAAAAGRAEGGQAALVASTVKARRDRVPVVVAGGTGRLGRNRKPAFKLLFGSEFGSTFFRQFGKPHIGSGSYWFFDTVDREQTAIAAEWQAAADAVVAEFGGL